MSGPKPIGEFSPQLRMVIFDELGREVDAMLIRMDMVKAGDKSQWMAQEAQRIVIPYVQAGANPNIMTFWVGVLVGSKLRKRTVINEEFEIDLHGQRIG